MSSKQKKFSCDKPSSGSIVKSTQKTSNRHEVKDNKDFIKDEKKRMLIDSIKKGLENKKNNKYDCCHVIDRKEHDLTSNTKEIRPSNSKLTKTKDESIENCIIKNNNKKKSTPMQQNQKKTNQEYTAINSYEKEEEEQEQMNNGNQKNKNKKHKAFIDMNIIKESIDPEDLNAKAAALFQLLNQSKKKTILITGVNGTKFHLKKKMWDENKDMLKIIDKSAKDVYIVDRENNNAFISGSKGVYDRIRNQIVEGKITDPDLLEQLKERLKKIQLESKEAKESIINAKYIACIYEMLCIVSTLTKCPSCNHDITHCNPKCPYGNSVIALLEEIIDEKKDRIICNREEDEDEEETYDSEMDEEEDDEDDSEESSNGFFGSDDASDSAYDSSDEYSESDKRHEQRSAEGEAESDDDNDSGSEVEINIQKRVKL